MIDPTSAVTGFVAKAALEVVKDTPSERPIRESFGRSGLVLVETLETILLPLAAVNQGRKRAVLYFSERFAPELEEKLGPIPEEYRVMPKESVVGPAMQQLGYSHEEDELRDMYLNLIATAMDGRAPTAAHPAYVEVIKQLSANEAELLRTLLPVQRQPMVEVQLQAADKSGSIPVVRHVLPLTRDGEQRRPGDLDAYVDNWGRLGLFDVSYDSWLTREDAYDWVEDRMEYKAVVEMVAANSSDRSVKWAKGVLQQTSFGANFYKTVMQERPAGEPV